MNKTQPKFDYEFIHKNTRDLNHTKIRYCAIAYNSINGYILHITSTADYDNIDAKIESCKTHALKRVEKLKAKDDSFTYNIEMCVCEVLQVAKVVDSFPVDFETLEH